MAARIICLLAGYMCGLLETGYLYGKMNGIDIRKHGSGNSGTTNALRVLGKKAGLVVFLGDFLKAFIPCIVVRLIMKDMAPDTYLLYVLYAGFGVVLGHNFPFYLKFKGGKGIAATAGTIAGLLDPVMIVTLLILFVVVVAITRYVSLGSILLMLGFVAEYIVFAFNGRFCFDINNANSRNAMYESIVIAVLFAFLAIYRHKANIVRLVKHEESKIGEKKKESIEELRAEEEAFEEE